MNSFDSIFGQMSSGGNNIYRQSSTSGSRMKYLGSRTVSDNNFSRASGNSNSGRSGSNNHSTQLAKMSVSALNNILSTYRKEIASSGLPEEERNNLKSRIKMIESELAGRGSSNFSASVMEDTSSVAAQEKKYELGAGVGTSSLIFGVLGFMGSSLMGSKHPFMWGVAGAGSGALMAFFMSNDKSFKLINPIQEIK